MLKSSAGIDVVHVPYKGAGDAINDLVAGRVDLMFMALTAPLSHVRQGNLKVLGVVGDKRLSGMPDVPSFEEQGIHGMELTGWLGVFAPARTPPPVIDRLESELARILRDPEVVERFREGGSEAMSAPVAFATLVRDDYQKWGEVIRRLGIVVN